MKKEPLRSKLKKQGMRTIAIAVALGILPLSGLTNAFTAAAESPSDTVSVALNGNDIRTDSVNGLTFKGFGVLSGNSTSALLMDYKSEQPTVYAQMLRTLFGGSNPIMSNIKIEMGNDRNNSTGPDPCTMRTADEPADVTRDPGFQLAADAKKLNPNLKITILRWESPGWVKTNDDLYKWFKNTILAAYRTYGYMVDYVNPGFNETAADLTWTKTYANEIKTDSTGFQNATEQALYNKIKVVISDEVSVGTFGDDMVADTDLRNAVSAAGYHYNTDDDSSGDFKKLADTYDKEVWNSEAQATFSNSNYRSNNNTTDPSVAGTGIGGTGSALEMANTIVKGFVNSRRTNFIYQPAIASFYEGGQYSSKSVVQATDPWSGWVHYDAGLDVLAQFSEFATLGWENDTNTAGIWRAVASASMTTATGTNPVNGRNGLANYITLAAPDKKNFSTVIVNDSEYTKTYQISATNMAYSGTPSLEMWETRAADSGQAYNSNYLKYLGDVSANASGVYTVTVKPYSIMTVTTLDKAGDSSLKQSLPAEGTRTVLDTDANGQGNDTTDTTLYADNYEYTGKTVPVINADGTVSTTQTEDFITSRGGDTGFTPLYTSDMNGAFEGYKTSSGNHVLRQQVDTTVVAPGKAWNSGDPVTAIGDNRWMNYKASIDVSFEDSGTYSGANYASLGVRQQSGTSGGAPYLLKFWQDGGWQLIINGTTVANGNVATGSGGTTIPGFDTANTAWHNIAVQAAGSTITALIDGTKVASYTDSAAPELSGRVTIGSGFYHTDFDNFKVETVNGYAPYYAQQLDDLEMYDLSSTPKAELVYGGSWSHANGQGMFVRDRSITKNTAAGATLSYTFTGTGFDICGDDDGSAKLDVTVDGKQVARNAATLDSGNLYQTYTLRGLSYGQHTVQVKVVSGTLTVDYVGVVSGLVQGSAAVNTAALSAQVAAANALTSSDYNQTTWTILQNCIAQAQQALADPVTYRLDQEGADALTARLRAAQNGLLAADVSLDTADLGLVGTATKQGDLPATVKINGQSVGVTWAAGSKDTVVAAALYSTVTLSGQTTDKLPTDGLYHPVTVQLEVVPSGLTYFIDSGASDGAPEYAAIASGVSLKNNHYDQAYTTGGWGYLSSNVSVKGSTDLNDKYSTGLYAKSGQNIVYELPLDAGTYQLTAGFNDWWKYTRPMSQTVTYTENGVTKTVTGDSISLTPTVTQATGSVTFTLKEAQTITYTVAKTGSSDPIISWLAVVASHTNPVFTANASNSYAGLLLKGNASVQADADKGKALSLDGSSGTYAQFDPSKISFDGQDALTLTMDVKSNMASGNFFTYALGQNSNKYLFLRLRGDNVYTAITTSSSGGENKSSVNLTGAIQGQWAKIAIVAKSGSVSTYVNGTLAGTATTSNTISSLGTNLLSYLGKSFYSGDGYFNGSFANINVYDRALSADEISLRTAAEQLRDLYNANSAKTQGDYTDVTWAAFQTALTGASGVLANNYATLDQVNAALTNLTDAVNGLQKNTVDFSALQALYDTNKDKTNDNYTAASWSAFQTALSTAQTVLADTTSTQAQVDSAAQALTAAVNGLVVNNVVKLASYVYAATYVGQTPTLPATVTGTKADGATTDVAVDWNLDATAFGTPYQTVAVTGASGGLTTTCYVEVVPKDIQYFTDVNATKSSSLGYDSPAYLAVQALLAQDGKTLLNNAPDELYSASNGWGYAGYDASGKASVSFKGIVSGDYSKQKTTGIYTANATGAYLTYTFDNVPAGNYTLAFGTYNWWTNVTRTENVYLNYDQTGNLVDTITLNSSTYDVTKGYTFTLAKTGTVTLKLVATTAQSPLLSFVALAGGADKTALQTSLTDAQALLDTAVAGDHEGNYPQSAIDALQTAVDNAEAVNKSDSASTDDVNAATTALQTAEDTFKSAVVTVDRTQLNTLTDASAVLASADYTPNSWATFSAALTAAQTVLAGKPSQSELDDALNTLQAAKDGLALKADTADLQKLVNQAAAVDTTGCRADRAAALENALSTAKAVLADPNATHAAVDSAIQTLSDALSQLVDFSELNAAITTARQLEAKTDVYSSGSLTAYGTAIAAAQKVASDSASTQPEVDSATAALNDAQTFLVDISSLKSAVAQAGTVDLSASTTTSANNFRMALDQANAALGNADVTQAQVDAALQDLAAATNALVPAADKSKLQNALNLAAQINTKYYRPASVKALTDAVTAGKAVMANGDATQKQVDDATSAITVAMTNLQKNSIFGILLQILMGTLQQLLSILARLL